MAPKRGRDDEESEGFGGASKGRLVFSDVVLEDLVNGIVVKIEPILRRVVREEVESCIVETLQSRPSSNRIETSGARGFQLRIEGKIGPTMFTGSRVETENNSPVKVVLVDTSSNIVSSGPMSNSRIEIVVIDSDFGSDDREDWTEKEFSDSILREREGKGPLVAGERTVALRHGVGNITDVSFTDNSSWTRSGKFKLGVRVVRKGSGEVRIREGHSDAFVVKDHRGELYQKKHPPHMFDDVWRLEKIRKDGPFHKRLTESGINNLMEFLRMYQIDSSGLRNVLGGRMSDKTWHTIINHAKDCVVDDDKLHIYYRESVGIVFDSVFKPIGLTFGGQNYQPLDTLDSSQRRSVQDLKRQAYKNVAQFVVIDKASFGDLERPFPNFQATTHLGMQTGLNEFEASASRATLEHPTTHKFVVPWEQGFEPEIEFLPSILNPAVSGTRSKAWNKIRAVVKWRISFKQAKELQASFEFDMADIYTRLGSPFVSDCYM